MSRQNLENEVLVHMSRQRDQMHSEIRQEMYRTSLAMQGKRCLNEFHGMLQLRNDLVQGQQSTGASIAIVGNSRNAAHNAKMIVELWFMSAKTVPEV